MSRKAKQVPAAVSAAPAALAKGAANGVETASADIVAGWVRLAPPWVAVSLMPPAAWCCHELWGASPWAAAGMTLTTAGLSALAWRISHARRILGRLHATVNTAASLGWITCATITGLHRPAIDLWIWGGATLAAAWNIRHRLHGPDESGDRLAGWWAARNEKAGLPHSEMRTVEVGTDRGTGRLELAEGQTVGDAVRNREVVAAMAGVPASGVRISPDPDDAGIANVTFVRRDMLRQVTPYTGPTHVGGLPTDPHELGTYEDGLRLKITLAATPADETGKEKNSYHLGIGGMNGAGKSGPVLIIAGDRMCRRESLVFVIDCTKREQTWGQMQDLIDLVAYDVKYARRLLKAIRDRLAPAIASYLGQRGLKNWEPGCGIPAGLLVIEEANLLPDDMKEMIVELLRLLRSLGWNISVSGQRWTYDGMPTSARAEIGGALQFGCADGDAGYLLGDLVDRGANPEAWKNRHQGRCYGVVPDVPDERHLIPLRIDHAAPAAVARLVRPHFIRTEMPDLFIEALGDVWTDRPRYDAPATPDTATSQEGWTPTMPHQPTDSFEDGETGVFDPAALGLEPDDDPDIQPGPDDDVPPVRFTFGPPPPKATPEQVRTEVLALIRAWGPGTEFGPSDLARALPAHAARHRSTMSRLVTRLVDDGALDEITTGRYRVPTLVGGYAT